MGHQAALMGQFEDIGGVVRLAAEFARERPFGAGAVAVDTADHARAGRRAGELLDLGLAVHGVERHAEAGGGDDLALLLDGVAIGDALGRGARRQRGLGLAHRGHVEAGAQVGQELEDFRGRIGLHRVEDLAVGQRLGERQIVLADDVEVDHEARTFICAVLEKLADACGHLDLAPLSDIR